MIKDKRNIDKLFEAGLKGFKDKPPAYAWDRMDKSLDRAQFKKSLVFLRWIAASILIFLAFGSGYYYAVYNLNSSNLSDVSNSSILDQQNNESVNQQLFDNSESNIAETTIPEKQKANTDQIENKALPAQNNELLVSNNNSDVDKNQIFTSDKIIPVVVDPETFTDQIENKAFPAQNNEMLASNDNSDIDKNQIFASDKMISVVVDPKTFMEIVTSMEKISFTNIPVDQQLILSFDDDNQFSAIDSEIAIANPAPMSIYYYPEDYDLNTPKKELDAKWAVGAQFAPVISYRDITTNDADIATNAFTREESQHNNAEDALLSYAGGVDVNYHVSKRWSIQSGLYFSRIGQVNNDALNYKQSNSQYQLFSVNTSTGNTTVAFEKVPVDIREGDLTKDTLDPINIGNVNIIQNFNLFEVPVMVKYKVLNKRFGINLSGGLSPAYLVSSNTYLETENSKHNIGNSENLNPMIINTTLALGLNYGITKKLTINFEPTFKYSLNPINKNSGFDYHPYYFSWYTGIRYNF